MDELGRYRQADRHSSPSEYGCSEFEITSQSRLSFCTPLAVVPYRFPGGLIWWTEEVFPRTGREG